MIPDPQTPLIVRSSVAAANPGSSLHRSQPMTLKRGASVSRSIRTRSIAPAVARWPHDICAPSNAGPVGLDAANCCSVQPSTISALVPTSTSNCHSSPRCGPSASIAAVVSAPTCPAMHGPRNARAVGNPSPRSSAVVRIASAVANVNGAWPSGVGSMPSTMWCMIGFPTITMSSSSSAGASAWRNRSVIRSFSAVRMHAVSSLSPPGFIITYETRLIRSSPNRICGFITPAVATTSPVDRSQRWPATVVEPTSMATPSAVSTKPGQMATATPSRSTAIVTEP